ncbi:MAG: glycosyltransferase family 4 protein [Limisphaerales bacterium]
MKIALVVHDFDPCFGQGRYTVELARRLAPQHDLHVYANRFGVPLEPNWSFQRVRAWRRTALTTILTFLWQVEKLLRSRPYDIIHAQGLTCWHADVITAHVCNAARNRRTAHRSSANWFFPAVVVPLERAFYRQSKARHLIAISKKIAGEVVTEYGWQRSRTVIYHGADARIFCPPASAEAKQQARSAYELPDGSWVWLFVGEAVKGLRAVLEQLPAFPEATLLVVSQSNLKAFRRRAGELGVESRVRFHGREENMTRAYQAADVFVYPSVYDAFGMVVAEAMAAELPVVVGENIGAAEWLVPQLNGLLCDPARPVTLREQLQWLRADPDRARAIGRAARTIALAHSWDACASATAEVYAQVFADRLGRP